MTTASDRSLKDRAAEVMPGGVYGHLSTGKLSPNYPQFFAKAKGAHLWDVEGRKYLDFMCAFGPNLLGYGHDAVNAAYVDQLALGDVMTGPSPVAVELAETFVDMVDGVDWVLFCKNGNDATTAALMTARKHTGKATIVRAKGAYHGSAPWCALGDAGVGPHDQADQIFHRYNDVEDLERAVKQAGGDLAAIFVSPIKHDIIIDQELPDPAYARRARELCDETGALLVVDNVRAGFRLTRGCSWTAMGVTPDLSSWGKSLANGHALSALTGADVCKAAASQIFVTGSFWFAAAPMAAALVTLRILRETDYLEHTVRLAEKLRTGLHAAAQRHGFGLRQTGPAQIPLVTFEDDPELKLTNAWTGALVQRGVYFHPYHNMFFCAAMTEGDIDHALEQADGAFADIKG